MPSNSTSIFFEGGRALERIWLMATKLGIDMHPQSPILFLFNKVKYDKDFRVSETGVKLKKLIEEYNNLIGINDDRTHVFIFRLSFAKPTKVKSERLPIEQTLIKV